ncbi:hypothetical protein E1202_27190 [Saccharopolyspora karakumensis]|uniref:Acetyltransferase (GNAT) family protein n=1 Tax=Saccharopolyspora karakumensis TaxID=2530386 RepID=A0A4R5BB85_9PSEU|nr:hypothetical protein E1202_27190 [Saccharopolyspora karakumensis]
MLDQGPQIIGRGGERDVLQPPVHGPDRHCALVVVYADLRGRGLGAQAAQHVIKRVGDASASPAPWSSHPDYDSDHRQAAFTKQKIMAEERVRCRTPFLVHRELNFHTGAGRRILR